MALSRLAIALPASQAIQRTAAEAVTSHTLARIQLQSWPLRTILSTSISIPAISINLPGLLSDLWEGVLKAVPKKKTSHMKKRHRQLAGKALKDVNSVNTCPGCGRPKKAHFLCPYCVAEIKESWKQAAKEALK